MPKVAVFESYDTHLLRTQINNFLASEEVGLLVDVKYSHAAYEDTSGDWKQGAHHYSALVIYRTPEEIKELVSTFSAYVRRKQEEPTE